MPKLTQARLRKVLAEELKLREPEFRLQTYGGKLCGSVISKTFRGKRDGQRQGMIWDALEYGLGPEAEQLVGMILAYTPDEWYADEIAEGTWPAKTRAKAKAKAR